MAWLGFFSPSYRGMGSLLGIFCELGSTTSALLCYLGGVVGVA